MSVSPSGQTTRGEVKGVDGESVEVVVGTLRGMKRALGSSAGLGGGAAPLTVGGVLNPPEGAAAWCSRRSAAASSTPGPRSCTSGRASSSAAPSIASQRTSSASAAPSPDGGRLSLAQASNQRANCRESN